MLGFSDVELNIDSLAFVKNIGRLLEMDWEVHISHSARKAN
jgi:hypothetical protein